MELKDYVIGEICKLMCHFPENHPSRVQVHDVCF
jgi:hypothetical protein